MTERVVELMLDASDSMNDPFEGTTRIAAAKEVLSQVVADDLPSDTPVALRVFGASEGCSSELMVSLAPLDRALMQKTIADIQAVGSTNIAGSLAAVAEDLKGATGLRQVVLVTDGLQTCPGNVEAELEKLKRLGFEVQLDIVGIADPDSELHGTFKEWAEACGGAYIGAHDSDGLHKALKAHVTGRSTGFPSKEDILELVGSTWSGNWDWSHDDARGDSDLRLEGDGRVYYSYAGGALKGTFQGTMGHGGGNPSNPIVMLITLPDGNEIRFRWTTLDKVDAEFWLKGKRAGQTRNNPAQTTAVLVRKE